METLGLDENDEIAMQNFKEYIASQVDSVEAVDIEFLTVQIPPSSSPTMSVPSFSPSNAPTPQPDPTIAPSRAPTPSPTIPAAFEAARCKVHIQNNDLQCELGSCHILLTTAESSEECERKCMLHAPPFETGICRGYYFSPPEDNLCRLYDVVNQNGISQIITFVNRSIVFYFRNKKIV